MNVFKKLFTELRSIGLSANSIGVRFAAYTDKNGNTLEIPNQLEVGAEVSTTQEDGSLQPATDGEYELESGVKIVVVGGKVSEIVQPEAAPTEEEMAAEQAPTEPTAEAVTPEAFAALQSQVEQLAAMMQQLMEAMQADQADDMMEMKEQVTKCSEQIEAANKSLEETRNVVAQMAAVLPKEVEKKTVVKPVNMTANKTNSFDLSGWAGAFSKK